VVLHRLNSAATLIQRTTTEAPRSHMYYIGLDVHKKTISYCVKDLNGGIQQEGKVGSSRRELDCWMKILPQPWSVGMEATSRPQKRQCGPLRIFWPRPDSPPSLGG
jgi:hypothetical protein